MCILAAKSDRAAQDPHHVAEVRGPHSLKENKEGSHDKDLFCARGSIQSLACPLVMKQSKNNENQIVVRHADPPILI